MKILNQDQENAIVNLKRWWISDQRFIILEGAAGTGKTFVVGELLKSLTSCAPIFTAPTGEACRQLQNVLPKDSRIMTTYSLLGFNFDDSKEEKKLKRGRESKHLDNANLIIVDEASMISEELLEALIDTQKKVLFIGHKAQLPPVVKELKSLASTDAPVFSQSWTETKLTIPQRSTGELYQFIQTLEPIIWKNPRFFKKTYSTTRDKLNSFILSPEGRQSLDIGETKLISWGNADVDILNKMARIAIHGNRSTAEFLPKDQIILTEPVNYFGDLHRVRERDLKRSKNSDDTESLATNSKYRIIEVRVADVLGIKCWELVGVEDFDGERFLYVPVETEKFEKECQRRLWKAYGAVHKEKEKLFREYHGFRALFAKVKYGYALTTHRSQGMTIPNVWVNWGNIKKCQNIELRHKLLYVAASRAKEKLYIVE